MTPLLGTKTSSAPVGANSGGDRRAGRSLLSCALWRGMGRLWRGMGGMGRPEPLSAHRPHQQQGLSGFNETRDTGLPGAPRGVPSGPARIPRFSRITRHETRITAFMLFPRHGFYRRPVAAFLRVVAQRLRRYGVAMERLWRVWGGYGDGAAWAAVERHGRHIAPAPASPLPSAFLGRPYDWPACLTTRRGEVRERAVRHFFWSEPGPLPWFSRITRHESRPFFACFDRRVVRNAGQWQVKALKSLIRDPHGLLFATWRDMQALFSTARARIMRAGNMWTGVNAT